MDPIKITIEWFKRDYSITTISPDGTSKVDSADNLLQVIETVAQIVQELTLKFGECSLDIKWGT